jgi:hypothetical protein
MVGGALIAEGGGQGAWTLTPGMLAKSAVSWRCVCGASMLRWGMEERLATERWVSPSVLSGRGETVAALAVHIAEAEKLLRKRAGSASHAARQTSRSLPAKPMRRSHAASGRSWGSSRPCGRPSAIICRILASPCSAASRGAEVLPACVAEAMLPSDSPA